MNEKRRNRARETAAALRRAEGPVRVLRSIAWTPQVKERFLAARGRELPEVEYESEDCRPTLEAIEAICRPLDRGDPVDQWLLRAADSISTGARMLGAIGTPDFLTHSSRLYGTPKSPQRDGFTTSLALANDVYAVLEATSSLDLGAPPPACHLPEAVAERLRFATAAFGEERPEVVVVDHLSANALAGPRAIRLRRGATFTDRDAEQLVQHELYVHVATSLNGRAQVQLPLLAAGHPGTTMTQEGLAVFAEMVTGVMDTDRFQRLADRVVAIQMAIEGASFLDVYDFFLARTDDPGSAFEHARRVFRGGVLDGGAPFTKDAVYLGGLLRVDNFLRVAISSGRADCVRLLFCGKLDLDDLPALSELAAAGLCAAPRYLPPWAEDMRHLVASLAFSTFMHRIDLDRVREHYRDVLEHAEPISFAPSRLAG